MESFKSLIISLVLIALFAFALLSFGFSIQTNNNVNTTILADSSLSQLNSSISSNINEFNTASGKQTNATASEQGEEQSPTGDLTLGSIFHSISTFGAFLAGMGAAIFSPSLLSKIGISPLISSILIAILAFIAIYVFWRLLKVGQ